MTVGDPKVTSSGKFNGQKGLKFVCLQNKSTRFPELDVFPTQPCPAGIMTVHHFPTFVPISFGVLDLFLNPWVVLKSEIGR